MIASSNHKENAMDVSIADKLCKLRKQNGLTQEDLADKLGVSRQAVSKWERAEASPDTDNLIMLANLYGVSLDELLEINVNKKSEENTSSQSSGCDNSAGGEDSATDNDKTSFYWTDGNGEECSYDGENFYWTDGKGGESKAKFKTDNFSWSGSAKSPHGVHIKDDEDEIYIDRSGVHVKDDEDEVHIGWRGIHINSNKGDHVFVTPDAVQVNKAKKRSLLANILVAVPYPIVVTIAYLIWGFLTDNGWAVGWTLYLTIPVYYSLFECVKKRRMSPLAYPVLMAFIFCLTGMLYGLWHPMWVLFVTIPVYYCVAGPVDKHLSDKSADSVTITLDDDDDDDDDDE